jgi:hypothetical protein
VIKPRSSFCTHKLLLFCRLLEPVNIFFKQQAFQLWLIKEKEWAESSLFFWPVFSLSGFRMDGFLASFPFV